MQSYLVNSINRKIDPDTPNATIKPFQKSVKKSLFIYYSQVVKGLKGYNFKYINTNFIFYSLRNATIGSNLDAFRAGNKPAKTLSPVEINHTLTISEAKKIGVIC